jgi:hypothetical protein
MPYSANTAARKRVENRAGFYTEKFLAATTSMAKTAVLFDHWRSLVNELPEGQTEQWIASIHSGLADHIARITQIIAPPEGDKRP